MSGLGFPSFFGFTPEVQWGTKVTPTTQFIELQKGGDRLMSREILIIKPSISDASIRRQTRVKRGPKEAGGEIESVLLYQGFETLLAHSLGQAVTTGASSPFTHTFTVSPTEYRDIIGLTGEVRRDYNINPDLGTLSFFYEGMLVDFIELSCSANDPLMRVLFGFVAEDVSTGTSSTATLPTAPPVSYYDDGSGGGVTWNSAGYWVNAFNVRLQWSLARNRTGVGSRTFRKPVIGDSIQCTGEFTAEFENLNAFTDFRAATARALQFKVVGDAVGTGNYECQINIPSAIITPTGEPRIDNEGIVYATYPFQGFFDGTDREMNIVLKNAASGMAIGSTTTA